MPFHIDPKEPVRQEIGGIQFLLRVLTQREHMRFAIHSDAVAKKFRTAEVGASLDEGDIHRLERCLVLGIAGWEENERLPEFVKAPDGYMDIGLLDVIPMELWMDLYLAIATANEVTDDDAKN